ncbi:MAG: LysR family transcriptional regulator [Gammaproteobacteria bacterium]|nr:LysR family transcriptional regulator [Gammaproteobacteria bacterium]
MDWDDLRFFLAVARAKSLRRAASDLQVNHTTVSRRINGFEKHLRVRLFDRLPSGYELTEAGEDLLYTAASIEEDVLAAERRVLGQDARLTGEIRFTLPDFWMTELLLPAISEFAQQYPGVDLEIISSYELFNLTRREADVALRVTRKPPEHLIGRRLASQHKALYASREYLEKNDLSKPTNDVYWVGWDDVTPHPKWARETPYPHIPVKHRLNHPWAQLHAVKAGLGVGVLPCLLADKEPDLERLPPGITEPVADIWLLTHPDLRYTMRIRTFMDCIASTIKANQDLIEGRAYTSRRSK